VKEQLDIVILGLSVTSSWGNGHATTYRSLIRGLASLGHRVLFLERDVPWYASKRDIDGLPYARTFLYNSLSELKDEHTGAVARADLVIVGSFVPEGPAVIEWVLETARGIVAFYDIDTPVTLSMLTAGDHRHLEPRLMPEFDLYLSFTGGPMLAHLETKWGVRRARPLYCAVDEEQYYPEADSQQWSLGYLGTYSEDRQAALECMMLEPARRLAEARFVVAGSMYPQEIQWPENVELIDHLEPGKHRAFYCSQRFTLNLTRVAMLQAGYSPSVRLFEAAACGTPIISDSWPGLEDFFEAGTEIFVARTPEDVLSCLQEVSDEKRRNVTERARRRTLEQHSSVPRAMELVKAFEETAEAKSAARV
jgi:spore maturation protein CgeB